MRPIFAAAKGAAENGWRTAKVSVFCAPARSWWMKAWPTDTDRPASDHRPAHREVRLLRLREELDYDVVNVEHDARYRDFWQTYLRMTERLGVTQQMAKIEMRRRLAADRRDAAAGRCGWP